MFILFMIHKKSFIVQTIFLANFMMLLALSLLFLYSDFYFAEAVITKNQSSVESMPSTLIGPVSNTTVNPLLLQQIKQFTPPSVVEVTPDVYTAIGYGPSNIIMLEGTDGILVIDSGSSVDQAKMVLSEFRKITDKPVSALIYTNGKADHVSGAGIFVNDSKIKGQQLDIIANSEFPENVFPSIGEIAKQKSIYELYWSGLLLPKGNESDSSISSGLGPNWKLGNISYATPNILFNDTLDTTYSGINITLISAPGPSPEQIYVWIPDKGALFSSDLVYQSFPNLYSMSGLEDVDIQSWIDAIDAMRELNATYLIPSHLLPARGYDNVSDILISYRDAISYLVQQTIRYINHGFNADEITEILELPPYLKEHPWLQEKTGELSWAIRQIYSYVVGWNSGDATWFNPITLQERGSKIVNGFGGLNATLDEVKRSIDNREYSWAAELATYTIYAYPDNKDAKLLKADALRKLGWENPTSGGRNWYLTQADILDGKINASTLQRLPSTNIVDQILPTVSIDDLLFNMIFKLDPAKSPDYDLILGLYLNDTEEGFTLEIRNDVVEYEDSFPKEYNIALFTDSETLKDVMVGKSKLLDKIIAKKVSIDGDIRDFTKFVRSFDQKFVIPIFNNIAN
ncbi:MAG TPA: alkyl sulfatase dimerization domain-containing protein [Nitrososphaeraceae archaeon]|nr:alkyl sulfatase dimerization domain-containing protein [Nitrososphaeraceae archaeon]